MGSERIWGSSVINVATSVDHWQTDKNWWGWFGWWRYLDFNDGGFEMLQLKKA
jgi:hypothetical protein